MILPISHEHHQSRRWPVVTLAIVIACVGVHMLFVLTGGVHRGTDRVIGAADRALEYLVEHPYLAPPPPSSMLLEQVPPAAGNMLAAARADGPPPFTDVEAEQRELDARYADFDRAIGEARVFRYGFVPRLRNWPALLTSMFVHGGWIHLLGNLWILWLCGCNLEDRWGRPVFAGVYLTAGLGAALLHLFVLPQSPSPLIGASGAIAGAMGGFLVVFFYTRIRFAYFFLPFPGAMGTFKAPAYLMLPLWLGWEMVSAAAFTGSGVAHWGHVGGFAVGFAAALGLRLTGAEGKLDAAVEATVTTTEDARILAATEHLDRREPQQALPLLREVLRERPDDIGALLTLSRAAADLRDDALHAEAYTKLIERHWATGEVGAALALFEEPKPPGVEARMPRALGLRVARHWAASRQAARAAAACERLRRDGLVDETAVRAAVLEATVRQGMGDLAGARALLDAARESPFSTLEIDQMIEAQATKLRAEERTRSVRPGPLPSSR